MLAKPEVEEQAELDWMVWCSASESLGELLKNADVKLLRFWSSKKVKKKAWEVERACLFVCFISDYSNV